MGEEERGGREREREMTVRGCVWWSDHLDECAATSPGF